MTILRFVTLLSLLLSACASSAAPPPENAGDVVVGQTDQATASKTPKAPPPAADSAPAVKPKGEIALPPGWMMATGPSGRPAAVHVPDGGSDADGFIKPIVKPSGDTTPAQDAEKLRQQIMAVGIECDEIKVTENDGRASFEWRRPAEKDGTRKTGKVIMRALSGAPGMILGCLGFWTEDVHQTLSADIETITDSIALYISQAKSASDAGQDPGMTKAVIKERKHSNGETSPLTSID